MVTEGRPGGTTLRRVLKRSLMATLLLLGACAAPAAAAPPPNDAPDKAGEFTTYFAPNGTPRDRAAVAELAEATADTGVPGCLGPESFARTVWYRVPATDRTREIVLEATGRTTALVDLAAFVQPATGANTSEPNACSGEGAGASEISEEPSSAVALRVPPGRSLLVQVGRRGAPGAAEDEQAIVSLAVRDAEEQPRPAGDEAADAPVVGDEPFAIGGATITEEEPAQPACPSLGSVWRRVPAGASTVAVLGDAVSTVTVFAGERPTADNAVDCVNRERAGALRVRADRRGPVWVRIGTDRAAAGATATIVAAPPPAAGAPSGAGTRCTPRPAGTRSLVRFTLAGRQQRVRVRNRFRVFPVTVQVRRGPLCRVRVALVGPRGRVYARTTVARLGGRRVVGLRRQRRLVPGRYRLRVTALQPSGKRVRVPSRTRLRLR